MKSGGKPPASQTGRSVEQVPVARESAARFGGNQDVPVGGGAKAGWHRRGDGGREWGGGRGAPGLGGNEWGEWRKRGKSRGLAQGVMTIVGGVGGVGVGGFGRG